MGWWFLAVFKQTWKSTASKSTSRYSPPLRTSTLPYGRKAGAGQVRQLRSCTRSRARGSSKETSVAPRARQSREKANCPATEPK